MFFVNVVCAFLICLGTKAQNVSKKLAEEFRYAWHIEMTMDD